MSDAIVTELRPSPSKGEGTPRPKDVTAALRAKKYRRKRKPTVTIPALSRQNPEMEKRKDFKADITVERHGAHAIDVLAYTAAIALAGAAAWFSIRGMVVLFPGSPLSVIGMSMATHVGDRGAATSAIETQDAALAAKIDVQVHTVVDLDRRLAQIDAAVEKAT
jgi:hypothetical protein